MLTVISPAKSLNLTSKVPTSRHDQPRLLEHTAELVDVMRAKSPDEIAELMHVSDDIAQLNAERYRDFELPFTRRNARQAVFTFNGDVYQGMRPAEFDGRDLAEATKTLRILSGLYGLLRPLDLVQPYRLEMGVPLVTDRGRGLSQFWGSLITDLVRDDLVASPGPDVLVNLASGEYSSAIDMDALDARVITPRFEDQGPKGDWKIISFAAKRARGAMAGWIVRERVRSAKALTRFDEGGYVFVPELSSPDVPVFRRSR